MLRWSVACLLMLLPAERASAQIPEDGKGLYDLACASCHGVDGVGTPPERVAFQVPVPDFTDCSFSSREPDADWIAVAEHGGPVRGFDETMPAFGEAFNQEQLQRITDYIRTFCGDARWPRGELNLPRPLMTEKAYPEDETVSTVSVNTEGPGAAINSVVYEKRFGPRSQLELEVPVGLRENALGEWKAGIGDIAVGFKHALFHSYERGSILSAGLETQWPTGSETNGFGKGTVVAEPFLSFGQILPGDGFLHAQALVELPFSTDNAESEAKWCVVVGRSWSQGGYGRTWTPMFEVEGETELEEVSVQWRVIPQVQVTLNTRQHVMANVGLALPVTNPDLRSTQLLFYLLWDWFDGGFFQGW